MRAGGLPDHDGVGASRVQVTPGSPATALEFLVVRFPAIPPDTWRARFQRGLVLGPDGLPLAESSAVAPGSELHYYREVEEEPAIPFEAEVIWHDEQLLVADKPHFLPVAPAGRYVRETLLVRLREQLGLPDLAPLHRIDRGTAGLVLFSVDQKSRSTYQALFPRREILKTYEALAPHRPDLDFPIVHRSRVVEGEPFFRMREVEGVANSQTRIEVAQRRGATNLYRLFPVTGRKHQLRVHLAALGMPIVGDPLYPELRPEGPDDYASPMKLLARTLAFVDPLTGKPRNFESRRAL